jgi:16S rRNA (guanine966-N2)-methyltransferase
MRVIGGLYRGRVLKTPSNFKTRPTSDRLRETLFNVLTPRINEETQFLDLCAGTGAIGIEALSRGVAHATFVDVSRKMCGLVEENLDQLEIPEDQTEIICEKAEKFLTRSPTGFDVVYFDPPYANDYLPVLYAFGDPNSKLLNEDGVLITEHSIKSNLPDLLGEIRRWRLLKQGDSALSFYQRN